MSKLKPREQLEIPGAEVPRDPVVTKALERWLDACDAKRASAEDAKLCAQVLQARLAEKTIAAYPYVDRNTGEKRIVRLKVGEAKLATAKAPKPAKLDRERDAGGESAADRAAESIVMATRRAVRATATDDTKVTVGWSDGIKTEIMPDLSVRDVDDDDIDPFASTRTAMTSDPARDLMTPAQRAAADSAAAREARRAKNGSSE